MFPERIGRMVLDGVCNAVDYSTGPGWLTNTVDADKVVGKLFEGCFGAGPQSCALARPDDRSASDISTRFWSWVGGLDEAPVSGLAPSGNYVVLTGVDVRLLVARAAYRPLSTYKALAQDLDAAMRGANLSAVLAKVEAGLGEPLQTACPVANATLAPDQGADAHHGIVCCDGGDVTGTGAAWWQAYLDRQLRQSSVFGYMWTSIRFPCARWRFKPSWAFRGPFTTPEASSGSGSGSGGGAGGEREERGKPAAPLLFLTNRLDPVTPLSAARAMAGAHPGARVVVQEAIGHCAMLSAYSECTRRLVREYLDSGKVPDGEASCEAECGPWDADCRVEVRESRPWHERRFPLGA
ncbi:hypothetical protein UVI_02061460 [Ustilaginoidea virens]|uniref:Peptidase S33 tripeptidyl aminopeptidase-like C-terminal domain-containing protein n=1 Tax=Ustilaginoidea virens TaxID=1159556 RepID=A0A1B5L6E4_USTVR|nr:hypothetical protein UVI_02061460 [Ustilaginoidea virens]